MKIKLEQHILKIGHLNDTLYLVGCGIGSDKGLSPEQTEGVLFLINSALEKEINELFKIMDGEDANVQK